MGVDTSCFYCPPTHLLASRGMFKSTERFFTIASAPEHTPAIGVRSWLGGRLINDSRLTHWWLTI